MSENDRDSEGYVPSPEDSEKDKVTRMASKNYDAGSIQVLEGLAAVRAVLGHRRGLHANSA